jgi:hypothetical protein
LPANQFALVRFNSDGTLDTGFGTNGKVVVDYATGLAVSGDTVYMAEAGPVPHLPENGKVVSFGPKSSTATDVASGAPMIVDVEFGRGRTLYALSNGEFSGDPAGSPGLPNTGAFLKVNADGTFTVIIDHLDRPTSFEFIGTKAYVVTLTGDIWMIDGFSAPPYGPLP